MSKVAAGMASSVLPFDPDPVRFMTLALMVVETQFDNRSFSKRYSRPKFPGFQSW
jgi:hypothetical protein